jgi:hypothetical protein
MYRIKPTILPWILEGLLVLEQSRVPFVLRALCFVIAAFGSVVNNVSVVQILALVH